MIALIGSEGSMGKRYQAIFRYLEVPFLALDFRPGVDDYYKSGPEYITEKAAACDRILICSPTHTHIDYLRELLPTKKPILCEKPISKDIEALRKLHEWAEPAGFSYQMVMQYAQIAHNNGSNRNSWYDFFRHGNDGLGWDCLQIIALAKGPIELKETSPWWECGINGQALSIADMDSAYVWMIRKWLKDDLKQTMPEILEAHEKVVRWMKKQALSTTTGLPATSPSELTKA